MRKVLFERGEYVAEMETPYELCILTTLFMLYYPGVVVKKCWARVLVLCIDKMEFLVSAFVSFVRCAQFCLPEAVLSARAQVLRNGQEIILLCPSRCERQWVVWA